MPVLFFQSFAADLHAILQWAESIWYGYRGSALPSVFHTLMIGGGGFVLVKGDLLDRTHLNKVLISSLLVWWICQSVFVESWYNPFSTFSLATVAVQWGVAMELFLVYNRRIADKTEANF